jgi:hypothetical protein
LVAPVIAAALAQQAFCAPSGCPATLPDWKAWRDRAISDLLRPSITRKHEKYLDTDKLTASAVKIATYIDTCAPSFSPSNELQAEIGNLAAFTHVFRNTRHQFGYSIDDFDYLSTVQENVSLPELLTSQEFLKKISHRRTYQAALKMITDQNASLPPDKQWTVLIYKSRFLTTPDKADTYGRFFVLVPGEKYQKWIQFGIKLPEDTGPALVNNLSVVSVSNPDEQGRRFNAIVDWWRSYHADGSITLATRRRSQGVTDNCVLCHKTSPLGIHPAEEYVFDKSGKLVPNTSSAGAIPKQLNALIAGYGAPYFNDWVDTTKYGPPLGDDKPRTEAFMQSCTSGLGLTADSIKKVKDNMTCVGCHSERGAGLLNVPETTSIRRTAGDQIYQYVSEGWMPPQGLPTSTSRNAPDQLEPSNPPHAEEMSYQLSENEREALYTCLIKEYLDFDSMTGTFVDWLKSNGRGSDDSRGDFSTSSMPLIRRLATPRR